MHDPVTLTLTLLSVGLTALAQICLKVGVGNPALQGLLAAKDWPAFIAQSLVSPWVMIGLGGYVVSTATWLLVLARADLSAAYPFVSLAFVATSLYGYLALHEPLGAARVGGIVLIIGGVLLVARS
jgi:multidrug transporter EmrE-like cation transporter